MQAFIGLKDRESTQKYDSHKHNQRAQNHRDPGLPLDPGCGAELGEDNREKHENSGESRDKQATPASNRQVALRRVTAYSFGV